MSKALTAAGNTAKNIMTHANNNLRALNALKAEYTFVTITDTSGKATSYYEKIKRIAPSTELATTTGFRSADKVKDATKAAILSTVKKSLQLPVVVGSKKSLPKTPLPTPAKSLPAEAIKNEIIKVSPAEVATDLEAASRAQSLKVYSQESDAVPLKTNKSIPSLNNEWRKANQSYSNLERCETLKSSIPNYEENRKIVQGIHDRESVKMRMVNGEMIKVISNIKHELELTIKDFNGVARGSGFHIYPETYIDAEGKVFKNNFLKNGNELIKIQTLKERDGCRLIKVFGLGKKSFEKTVCPASWSYEFANQKKFEAFANHKIVKKTSGKNTWIARGKTIEGIEVEFIVKKNSENEVEIITSYISQEWIEKGIK